MDIAKLSEAFYGEITDGYIIVTADGRFVSANRLELSKQAAKTLSSSFFDCLGTSVARRITDAIDEAYPYPIGVEVQALGQYNYGAVEIRRDFGVPYLVVRLYKTKREYLYSDFTRRTLTDRISKSKPDFSDARDKLYMGELASASAIYSDAIAISSMLETVNKREFDKTMFDIASVNSKIVSFYATNEAKKYTDCKITDGACVAHSGISFFAQDRDLTEYVAMVVSLIASLTLVSTSRIIRLTTDVFEGSARVTVETDTADIRLKTMSSTDVGVFASAVPRAFSRIIKAEYIAVSQNIRLLAVGSLSAGTIAFDLTVTNERQFKVEFKHGNPMDELDKIIRSASAVFPMGVSAVQAEE